MGLRLLCKYTLQWICGDVRDDGGWQWLGVMLVREREREFRGWGGEEVFKRPWRDRVN